jgi:hypothetical protein
LQGRVKHSWSILQAQVDFFKLKNNYKPTLIKRQVSQIYCGVIPFVYFIQRKRKFSSLNQTKFSN